MECATPTPHVPAGHVKAYARTRLGDDRPQQQRGELAQRERAGLREGPAAHAERQELRAGAMGRQVT